MAASIRSAMGHRVRDELHFARFEPFQVEDVVDQAHQAVGVGLGNAQHLGRLFGVIVEGARRQHGEGTLDGGHGGAQFVADDADKFVFHAVDFVAFADVLGNAEDANHLALVVEGSFSARFDIAGGAVGANDPEDGAVGGALLNGGTLRAG
jgi:hypothetical protein